MRRLRCAIFATDRLLPSVGNRVQTIHPPACQIARSLIIAIYAIPLLGGCADLDFSGSTELKGKSYSQYVTDQGNAWFDPRGASDIWHRHSSTRDGSDSWWRFMVSESDFLSIVMAVAKENQGPAEIKLDSSVDTPPQWDAESEVPAWWVIDGGTRPQSIHWCFRAGDAERHHGWFFAYNPDSQTAWCWHWNHQWSSSECR